MNEHVVDHKNHRFRYDGLLIYRPVKSDPSIFFSGLAASPAAIRAVLEYLTCLVDGKREENKTFGAGPQSHKKGPEAIDWENQLKHTKQPHYCCCLCDGEIATGEDYYTIQSRHAHVGCVEEMRKGQAA